MISDLIQSHRVCVGEGVTYALSDPRESDRHPVRADKVPVVRAFRDDPKNSPWMASCKALQTRESYSSLIRDGRLVPGLAVGGRFRIAIQ
jgi:hypothetical protein